MHQFYDNNYITGQMLHLEWINLLDEQRYLPLDRCNDKTQDEQSYLHLNRCNAKRSHDVQSYLHLV